MGTQWRAEPRHSAIDFFHARDRERIAAWCSLLNVFDFRLVSTGGVACAGYQTASWYERISFSSESVTCWPGRAYTRSVVSRFLAPMGSA